MNVQYFYIPGATYVLAEFPAGATACRYSNLTLVQLQEAHPKGRLGSFCDFNSAMIDALRENPQEIDRASFLDALDTLPPQGWVNTGDSESFKFMEHYAGDLTSVYARIGTDYWRFLDVASLSHEAIVTKIRHHMHRTVVDLDLLATTGEKAKLRVEPAEQGAFVRGPEWAMKHDAPAESVTITATVAGISKPPVVITGDEWRALEGNGLLGDLWAQLLGGSPVETAIWMLTGKPH